MHILSVVIGGFFLKRLNFSKVSLQKNGYPDYIFYSCVKKFVNSKFDNANNVKVTEDKVETVFLIPYIGLPSVIFGRKLREIFKRNYCIDVKVIFTSFKVKNCFSLKCRAPLPLLANVVYKFKCLRDANTTYIGKTVRHLATRVREHGTSPSAIKDHLLSCNLCSSNYSIDQFSVIASGKNDNEITIKEALHIK